MPLNKEDILEIQTILDDRYVLQSDCNDKQNANNERFADDDKRIEKLIDRFNTWDKLLWTIATASIGALVAELFGLILK